jgi:hypothetical protein
VSAPSGRSGKAMSAVTPPWWGSWSVLAQGFVVDVVMVVLRSAAVSGAPVSAGVWGTGGTVQSTEPGASAGGGFRARRARARQRPWASWRRARKCRRCRTGERSENGRARVGAQVDGAISPAGHNGHPADGNKVEDYGFRRRTAGCWVCARLAARRVQLRRCRWAHPVARIDRVVENALMRLLADQPGGVPVPLVEWVVTGHWSAPALRCDAVAARAEFSGTI